MDTLVIVEIFVLAALIAFGIGSGIHALLNKTDPRSMFGWCVACNALLGIGPMMYWLIGANRIRMRAQKLQQARPEAPPLQFDAAIEGLAEQYPEQAPLLEAVVATATRLTGKPLLRNNSVEPLRNGEEAYPAMLAAIASAQRSICLSTYIFDSKGVGADFITALKAAAQRGVEVRVLIDAIGERYSRPRVSKQLRDIPKLRVARFLPPALSLRGIHINLRNHRKLLIVDTEVGFTGGMNIAERHLVAAQNNANPTADWHFRLQGPIVWQLEESFYDDWTFTTEEPPPWQDLRIPLGEGGHALCRGISDGPHDDHGRLQWILIGALACARKRVQILTPYFIPTRELVAGLNSAALRGVTVDVIIPARSNLRYVDWASRAMLGELLRCGVHVWQGPAPFEHGKLFVVDGFYVQIGSANLDPRSLRLNFEFNVEIYDPVLGAQLSSQLDRVCATSEPLTLAQIENRSFWVQLRDALCKLFAPYL